MNTDRKLALAAGLGLSLFVGGCAIDPKTGDFVQYELGEASEQTLMAQVIDPDPQYDTLVPVSSGDHAAQAIDRYRKGNVKEPQTQSIRSATRSN